MQDKRYTILKRQRPWRDAYFYQKSEVIYQLTYIFCKRFLPAHGDRTVDQMIQAARSGKQNIIEGTEDGTTSTEIQIKLINVARGSIQELREDYYDYLQTRDLAIWTPNNERYDNMQRFCKSHNRTEDYKPYMEKWNEVEMANTAITLCHMVDTMLNHHIATLEKEFVEQGGIKERMHAARTGYRQAQDEELAILRKELPLLKQEIVRLQKILEEHGINY